MIDRVVIRNFKRFENVTFDLQGRHVVLAGPNNTGKTTVLQAIAAWGFALRRWHELGGDVNPRNGWKKVPVTLEQFLPVSVRSFDLLWRDRACAPLIEVEVHAGGRRIAMEFEADRRSLFQVFVRPTADTTAAALKDSVLDTVFVPSMTGVSIKEPVYQQPKLEQLLGQNKPGEILRNLLAKAYGREDVWGRLDATVRELFGIELLAPDDRGADIVADYRHVGGTAQFDIASGGSGFQQVLMLLAFLGTRENAVLLLDEPDAHLHVFLQQAIFQRLRDAAVASRSQLVVATHSEVLLNSVPPEETYVLVDEPRRLVDRSERELLAKAMRVLDNTDLMKARIAPGVLYLEDYTDLLILHAFARVLGHPAEALLGPQAYWRKVVADIGDGQEGIKARDHFQALRLVRPGYPGILLVDGDSRVKGETTRLYGNDPPKTRWRRYEIESYLLHPVALERFVYSVVGKSAPGAHGADLRHAMAELLTQDFVDDPMHPKRPAEAVLASDKARTRLLPPILDRAGLIAFPYTSYHEIAVQMVPDEIDPEVREKLDAICTAFGVPTGGGGVAGAPTDRTPGGDGE